MDTGTGLPTLDIPGPAVAGRARAVAALDQVDRLAGIPL